MATARLGQATTTLGSIRLSFLDSNIHTVSASNTLGLTDTALSNQFLNVSASNALALSDFPIADDHLYVFDTLALTDATTILTYAVHTTISLADAASFSRISLASASHVLSLVDSAIGVGGNTQPVASVLTLTDLVTFDHSLINISINDTLSLSDQAQLGRTFAVSDTLVLTDSASHSVFFVTDTLALVDTATVTRNVVVSDGNPFGGILQHNIFSHTVLVNQVSTHTASTVMELGQSVGVWVESAQDCTYAPTIGVTADLDVVTPPPTQPPLTSGTLTLTWPFVSPTMTVVLRNPEYDNKFQYQPTRINRETRGGTLIIFSDPVWPKLKKLEFTVTYLQGIQMQNLQAFLLASIGQTIGLLDWEGQQWEGVILNPDAEISNAQRGNWSIGLQFEGVLT